MRKFLLEIGTLPTLLDDMVWSMLYFRPKDDFSGENLQGGTLGVRKDRLRRCGEALNNLGGYRKILLRMYYSTCALVESTWMVCVVELEIQYEGTWIG